MALFLALAGCKAPAVELEDDLQVDDALRVGGLEPAFPGQARNRSEPPRTEAEVQEVEVERPNPWTPRVIVRELQIDEELLGCPLDVIVEGLPAITTDGNQVVYADYEVDDASTDELEGTYNVHWMGTGRADTIYDGGWQEELVDGACPNYERKVRRAAERVNAQLAKHDWRPLEQLDVLLLDPYEDAEYRDPDEVDPMTVEPAARPVEVMWRNGQFLARTRGVKVYVNEPADWWKGKDDELGDYDPCDAEPILGGVYGDRESGVLLVTMSYERAVTSCMCPNYTYYELASAPVELFDRLEKLAKPVEHL